MAATLSQLATELQAKSLGESLARSLRTGIFPERPRELLAAACAKAALLDCKVADEDLSELIGETMSQLVPVEADGKVTGFAFGELSFTNQKRRG